MFLATWTVPAQAGGLSFPTFGGEHGHPTTANATALYFNPGALTQGEGLVRLYVDGTVVFRKQEYAHAPHPSDDVSVPGANDGKAKLFNVLAAPFLGVTLHLGDLAIGAAAYAPIGGAGRYDDNGAFKDDPVLPGPEDGIQRWHNISGNIISTYYTLGAAYEVLDGFSVGVAGNLIHTDVEEVRARTPTGDNNLQLEGRSFFNVEGVQFSFAAGVLWEVFEETLWLGASYQGAPGLDGRMSLDGSLVNAFPPQGPANPVDVELRQRYPDIFRAGVRVRPSKDLELRVFGDYQRWSLFVEQCVVVEDDPCKTGPDGANLDPTAQVLQNAKRNWNDTYGARVGVSVWTDPDHDVELMGGIGFDSNAAPDSTLEPGLTDANKIHLAAGARFRLGSDVHVGATYTHLQLLERDTTGKSVQSAFSDPTRTPDAGGKYTGFIGFFTANLEIGF